MDHYTTEDVFWTALIKRICPVKTMDHYTNEDVFWTAIMQRICPCEDHGPLYYRGHLLDRSNEEDMPL
jgi:hypothetical protein